MRVLCIGDSLGLPREGCPYESTWFYKLKENYPQHEFISYFKRGLLIREALDNYDLYYQFYNPDVVILQTGVCDCSPRYINDKGSLWKFLIKVSILMRCESLFWKIVKLRGRSEKCVYTKLKSFVRDYDLLLKKITKQSGVENIYIILIGKSSDAILERNKFFNINVEKYNDEIKKICNHYPETIVLDSLGNPTDDIFTDGYHCNEKGMSFVFRTLKDSLDKLFSAKS